MGESVYRMSRVGPSDRSAGHGEEGETSWKWRANGRNCSLWRSPLVGLALPDRPSDPRFASSAHLRMEIANISRGESRHKSQADLSMSPRRNSIILTSHFGGGLLVLACPVGRRRSCGGETCFFRPAPVLRRRRCSGTSRSSNNRRPATSRNPYRSPWRPPPTIPPRGAGLPPPTRHASEGQCALLLEFSRPAS